MEREVREGMKVRSRDGADLGRVMLLEGERILIEKGFFFPKDYWIHVRDIADLRDDEVLLTLSADELREGSGAAPEVAAGGIAGTQPAGIEATGLGEVRSGDDRMHGAAEDVRVFQEKTISVPVREEEVEIRKRPSVKEEVRVSKTPVHTERRVEAEVRREEARIEGAEDAGRIEEGGGTIRREPGVDDPGIGEPER